MSRVGESMWRIHRRSTDCSFKFSVGLKISKSKNKHVRGKDFLKGVKWFHILPNFSGHFCNRGWGSLLFCSGRLGLEAPSSPKLVHFVAHLSIPRGFSCFALGPPPGFQQGKVKPSHGTLWWVPTLLRVWGAEQVDMAGNLVFGVLFLKTYLGNSLAVSG